MRASHAPSDVAPIRDGEQLDWARLEHYLRTQLPEAEGPFSVLQFPRGSANLTYQVRFGEATLVVRRPPFGQLAKGSHDMKREYRVLSGLNSVYDRAPRALLHCADSRIIGAEFFVSEYRSGVVVWDSIPNSLSSEVDATERVGLAVVEALADLHQVDPAETALADLGRPDGYLERQLAGWTRRWDAVGAQSNLPDAHETRAAMDEVQRRLTSAVPAAQRAGIVHNDFKIDNCQFRVGDPDRVYSVFDWDMATTGDPLCDFGTLLNYWPDYTLPVDDTRAFIAATATRNLNLPSRAQIVERYAASCDLDLSHIDWYEAFGCWKTAVILQQLYARSVRGETTDPRMQQRGEMVRPLALRALATLGTVP
ncbi:phosphotransferase family protein [Nocardioides sp. YIM 152315]|uniref:phosphotransferase family protein n=1 Tax=Nocardioides sp. YIM 152315 TaxID=3031760 RepID=UPI0023DBC0D4|nr:phosphotransferase family protein [Nocardioides sp. YIM 152315]MDF1602244.1 phosphotransferase family protein [Nocardioides sp. YIM 152315]